MARVKFNVTPYEDMKSAWGYPIEHTEEGVFGEVPDALLEVEVAAGRVVAPAPAAPVAKQSKSKE